VKAQPFDDEAFDREILAERLGGGEFDVHEFARAIGTTRGGISGGVARGTIPAPHRTEKCQGGIRALWSAEQVAGVLIERRRPVPRFIWCNPPVKPTERPLVTRAQLRAAYRRLAELEAVQAVAVVLRYGFEHVARAREDKASPLQP
jgi:hypothetical protein